MISIKTCFAPMTKYVIYLTPSCGYPLLQQPDVRHADGVGLLDVDMVAHIQRDAEE